MRILYILLVCGMTACATRPHAVKRQHEATLAVGRASATPGNSAIVTPYELGSYRYPSSRTDQNETVIYRRTRVAPMVVGEDGASSAESQHEMKYVPSSFAPLPPSAELAVELTAQKVITEELRAIKTAMVEMEQKARAQYDTLVRRSEEAIKAREQLETQGARVRELEAQLRERLQNPPVPPAVATPAAVPAPPEEVKW